MSEVSYGSGITGSAANISRIDLGLRVNAGPYGGVSNAEDTVESKTVGKESSVSDGVSEV